MTKFSSKRPLTDEEEAEIQRMIASDPDAPELTDEQALHPMTFAEAIARKRGRPSLPEAKEAVTLRLDPEVVRRFKARGEDWRAQMARILADAAD